MITRGSGWRIAGRWCAVLGWVLWVVMQAVNADPFPPTISVSQYGLGGTGWVFSLWVVVLTTGPLLLLRYRPVPGPTRWLLGFGYAGAWLMALVRTDEGGAQLSTAAHVHMVGATATMVLLPLGILSALRFADSRWQRVAAVLAIAALVASALLLLAAAGLSSVGATDPANSWALWQGVLVIVEMLLVGSYAIAVATILPTPVQSSIS